MIQRALAVNQRIEGGRIIIDKADGPLYVGCEFRRVEFAVEPDASANGKPLFEGCHMHEDCTGYIGHTKLGPTA